MRISKHLVFWVTSQASHPTKSLQKICNRQIGNHETQSFWGEQFPKKYLSCQFSRENFTCKNHVLFNSHRSVEKLLFHPKHSPLRPLLFTRAKAKSMEAWPGWGTFRFSRKSPFPHWGVSREGLQVYPNENEGRDPPEKGDQFRKVKASIVFQSLVFFRRSSFIFLGEWVCRCFLLSEACAIWSIRNRQGARILYCCMHLVNEAL